MSSSTIVLAVAGAGAAVAAVHFWWRARRAIATALRAEAAARVLARGELSAYAEVGAKAPEPRGDGVDAALGEVYDRLCQVRAFADAIASRGKGPELAPRAEGDELGRSLAAAADRAGGLQAEAGRAANELADTARASSAPLERMKEAGPEQRAAAEETAVAMEEMAAQVKNVAQNAESIATRADDTSREIQRMVEANDRIAKGGAKVMEGVSEASETVERMAASIKEVAATAENLDGVAVQVASEASSGGELLDESARKLAAVTERTKESSALIETLVERSSRIGSITQLIEGIADQTNLLALNAAIEAARAGDAGRGFAVVADEVRKLAERSMGAAKEIREVIDAVQSDNQQAVRAARSNIDDIQEGAAQVMHTSGRLKMIITSIEDVTAKVSEVQETTREQSKAAEEVMNLVRSTSELTRSMVDSAREHADSSHNVLNSAQSIAGLIQQVADASAQQKVAGDQILASIEHVTQIAGELVELQSALGRAQEDLLERAQGLVAAGGGAPAGGRAPVGGDARSGGADDGPAGAGTPARDDGRRERAQA